MLTKRKLGQAFLGMAGTVAFARPGYAIGASDRKGRLERELARLESESGGRLGVSLLDKEDGFQVDLHGDDRFPMCSTFKFLAAAAVLKRIEHGQSRLDERIKFESKDVVANSPVTRDHVETGMTLSELCEAALTQSDNTAGNMLLREIDGPIGLTAFVRSLGDRMTRLDRWEVELNEAAPNDPRDTTTPAAMLSNLQNLILGETLSEQSRQMLTSWMLANKTGGSRLRAGLPREWKVADKTGTGERGTANDIGVFWPPGRKPLLVAVYLTGSPASAEERNATIAKVARAAVDTISIHGG